MEFSIVQLAQDLRGMTPSEHGFTHLDLRRVPTGRGRLDGWIISAKDLQDVAGMPTGLGNPQRAYLATETDAFIAHLEEQGALIVGKSATPELGLWVDTPGLDNPLWPGHTPGGSSGGAAVQVARGLLRAAHASDGGGSIRVPAAACGVVGFKPAGNDLAVAGFITRTVADSAYLHHLTPAKRPARIGVLTTPLFADTPVAPPMLDAVAAARELLAAQGHELVDIDPYPQVEKTFETFTHLFTSRLATLPVASGYVAWIRQQGKKVSPYQLTTARNHAAELPQVLKDYWQVDAILTPTIAFDPPPAGHFNQANHRETFQAQTRWSPWGSLFNVAQLPAISLPLPLPGRPPASVQLGAITLSEAQLLGIAQGLHP